MKNDILIKTALVFFIGSLSIVALILAKNILIPLAISVFFAYLIYPIVLKMEKWGLHRALSILSVIFVAVLIVAGLTLFLSVKLSNTSIDLNELKTQVENRADSVQQLLAEKFDLNTSTIEHYQNKSLENFFSSWEKKASGIFTATTTTLFQIGILPVFIFFLLFYRTKTAFFIFRLVGRKNKAKALHILREISTVTTKYMRGLLIVVAILAVLNSTGLAIIGVPHALLFGILAALLNLIPYFGTFLGGLIPVLYVLFSVSNPFNMVLKIVIMFIIVQFLENNLLTPNIVGNNIKINPLAIMLSLLFANMVWGVAGMLIIVPCLAITKIVMRNIDSTKPFAYLISDRGVEKYKLHFNYRKLAFWKK